MWKGRLLSCLSLTLLCYLPKNLASNRHQRADDPDPILAVVNELSTKVEQLTAQLQAKEAEIATLQAKVAVLEQPVAFTAAIRPPDITGLGVGQTVKFNQVVYNVGSGYDPTTGYFTAPSAGTYAFYVHVLQNLNHNNQEIQLFIYKGNQRLVVADACCDGHHTGTNMVTVHLNKGETTHVQVSHGSMLWGDHTTFTGFKLAPN